MIPEGGTATADRSIAPPSSDELPPRGELLLVSCTAGTAAASRVATGYREIGAEVAPHLEAVDARFSDGETSVRLGADVRGRDAFLFQTLLEPTAREAIDHNLLALLIAARALVEWGARHVTAVLPYLAYARQDRPSPLTREPCTARLVADLLVRAGIDRLMVFDPHSPLIPGLFAGITVDVLPALPLLCEEFRRFAGAGDVVAVAPDAGAAERVSRLARALDIPVAVASKRRPRPDEALVTDVEGDFTGKRTALVIDDMISTGGTVSALVERLYRDRGIRNVHLAASHCMATAEALDRLDDLHKRFGLREVVVTDSVPVPPAFASLPYLSIRPLAGLLALAVHRVHHGLPVADPSAGS
jgi:ribose-phosphate pyrophosphokinase